MENLEQKIKELLGNQFFVLKIHENIRNSYIRITVDSENPVTADTTSEITKMIQESEILIQYYPEGVRLEVSSPGIGSPLEFPFQYKKNIGRKISLQINDDNGIKNIQGKLDDATEDEIQVQSKTELMKILYESIQKAKIIVSFD
jgi:ribosome maturation factor RimP